MQSNQVNWVPFSFWRNYTFYGAANNFFDYHI